MGELMNRVVAASESIWRSDGRRRLCVSIVKALGLSAWSQVRPRCRCQSGSQEFWARNVRSCSSGGYCPKQDMGTGQNTAKTKYAALLLSLDGDGSLVNQLVRALRLEIGIANVGARLPSTRTLAQDLGMSRNTVSAAYGELANDGLIVSRFGGGSFIGGLTHTPAPQVPTASMPATQRPPVLSGFGQRVTALEESPVLERPELHFDFRYGLPVLGDFPFTAWSRIVARQALNAAVAVTGYGNPSGHPGLRAEIAEYLRRARGIDCRVEEIIITNGSQQALDLIARVLVDPGDRIVLEEPHYEGARQAMEAAGARVVAVPVDGDGLQVDKLPGRSARCRLVYVTPSHQFPAGAVLSAARRRKLLDWASTQNCFVVEDDYDGELRYDVAPLAAIKGQDAEDRVIYVGTLSKVLFPSLRVGYIVSPRSLVKSLVAAKHICDRQTPTVLQSSLCEFLAQGHFNRHLSRVRALCARRRKTLLRAIDAHLGDRVTVEGVNAGVHVMVWLKDHSAGEVPALVKKAESVGVGIYPVAPYFLHPPRRAGFLLGYASMEEAALIEGIRRLSKVFA